ncbi:MAG: mechanosensitive ion channel [Spirulinaceae cyanobacterium RM2_2_10]|nr:mechanosensitive ion channel [Spirulinaceae cyanobacterium SM2_1_0]NJO19411.1 mechanosensitive ion channel [Spirulinaceae cyanobacterium RM2_2_10]
MNLEFLDTTFLDNQVSAYLLAVAILILGILVAYIVRAILVSNLKRWAKQTSTDLDNALIRLFSKALVPLIYLGSFYLAIDNLNLHPILDHTIDAVVISMATIVGIRLINSIIEYTLRVYLMRHDNPNLEQSLNALLPAVRIVIWAIGAIFLLDNLGFDVSAVIASLGVGGLAFALAAKGVLTDLFSYFSILLDRPFELGDFIIVDDFIGTVERIGLKTTRLTSLNGEELVIANTDLTDSRLRNYKQMRRRRISFQLGVIYETAEEKLQAIPGIIERIVRSVENVTFDRAHFASYGDFSLNYEVVYYVEGSDYTLYMDVQQRIYLEIFRAFAAQGIEFAYPTQVTRLDAQAVPELLRH